MLVDRKNRYSSDFKQITYKCLGGHLIWHLLWNKSCNNTEINGVSTIKICKSQSFISHMLSPFHCLSQWIADADRLRNLARLTLSIQNPTYFLSLTSCPIYLLINSHTHRRLRAQPQKLCTFPKPITETQVSWQTNLKILWTKFSYLNKIYEYLGI